MPDRLFAKLPKSPAFKILYLAIAAIFALQVALWSIHGAGSTEHSFTDYPEGYVYYSYTPGSDAPHVFHKEDLRYISQYFHFLGDTSLAITKDWPAQRNPWSFLLTGLWPLGFVLASVLFNAIFWLMALWGGVAMMRPVTGSSRFAMTCAALFVLFHQGFLWAVAETTPHAAGYAVGFVFMGLAATWNLFNRKSRYVDFLKGSIVLAVFSLFYHSAVFYMPLLAFLALRRYWSFAHKWFHRPRLRKKRILSPILAGLGLALVTTLPYLGLRWLLMHTGFIPPQGSEAGFAYNVVLRGILEGYAASGVSIPLVLLKNWISGFCSFGPIVLPLCLVGAGLTIWRGTATARICLAYFILIMTLLLPNFLGGDDGYAAITLAPFAIMMAVLPLEALFRVNKRTGIAFAALVFVALAIWVNLPRLAGWPMPFWIAWRGFDLVGFLQGDASTWKHIQPFDLYRL